MSAKRIHRSGSANAIHRARRRLRCRGKLVNKIFPFVRDLTNRYIEGKSYPKTLNLDARVERDMLDFGSFTFFHRHISGSHFSSENIKIWYKPNKRKYLVFDVSCAHGGYYVEGFETTLSWLKHFMETMKDEKNILANWLEKNKVR